MRRFVAVQAQEFLPARRAAVLTPTGRGYVRAALIQGTLPLIGFVLFLFA